MNGKFGGMRPALVALILVFSAVPACGGDDGGDPDAARPDALLGADAADLPDAAATTSCGELPDTMFCDTATEVCVLTDLGTGSLTPACEAAPAGCFESLDRGCTDCSSLCTAPADTCDDSADDNTIQCTCLNC